MSEERRKILDMLAGGKITAGEAEELLDAVAGAAVSPEPDEPNDAETKRPRWLRVQVEPRVDGRERVNIRVPLLLVRTGIKLHKFIPGHAKDKLSGALNEHGFDPSTMDAQDVEALIEALSQTAIEVDDEKEHVRIFCE